MRRESRIHRRCHASRLVDAPEVVIHEVWREGCRVVLHVLGQSVREPVKRRIDIRIVRFWRFTYDVERCFGPESLVAVSVLQPMPTARLSCVSKPGISAVDLLQHGVVDAHLRLWRSRHTGSAAAVDKRNAAPHEQNTLWSRRAPFLGGPSRHVRAGRAEQQPSKGLLLLWDWRKSTGEFLQGLERHCGVIENTISKADCHDSENLCSSRSF